MTVQPANNLRARANAIRTAVAGGSVTPSTVGGLLVDMIDSRAGINPLVYGAIGDGTTDDSAALTDAITVAITAGLPVTGYGRTYGIAGNLTLPANAWLQDISFKQLTPGGGTRRTLVSSGVDGIKLIRVVVDRNGDGTNGSLGSDAGIWIYGGSGHYFENVEVFGNDKGTGVAIFNASRFELVRTYVHDIRYVLGADPGDDQVQGVWFVGCSDFTHVDTKAHGFGGNFGSGATQRYSRAIVYGDCNDFTVVNARAWDVDQGHDVTGGPAANERFSITGGLMRDCLTWGWKFANTARDGTITGAIAEACGLAGFEVSGGGGAANTCDLEFHGCVAYDTGSNGFWPNARGFDVSDDATGLTVGIRFIDCKAHDRQAVPTMVYGFQNDTVASTDGRYNECINCRSIGHTSAAFQGMNASRCRVGISGAQAVGTGSWTAVNWDTETDLGSMHSLTSNNDQIHNRRPGVYRLTGAVTFAANATGQRGVRWYNNGNPIPGSEVLVNAASSGETSLISTIQVELTVTVNLVLGAFQSSGGNLDLQTTTIATVEQVG